MANIMLKGIPDPLYQKLKRKAREDLRSLTQEVIWLLSQGISHTDNYTEDELIKLSKLAGRSHRGKTIQTMEELTSYLKSLRK